MSDTPATPAPEKRRPRWRRWLLEAVVFLAAFSAFQLWQARDTPRGAAPNFSGQLIDGQAFELATWRDKTAGRAQLLYFWAEWCPICKTTAGNVSKISADWPVTSIASQSGSPAQVARVMQDKGYQWSTLPDPQGKILSEYGLHGVPAFVIINPSGEISFVSLGFTSEIGLRLRLWWASRETS